MWGFAKHVSGCELLLLWHNLEAEASATSSLVGEMPSRRPALTGEGDCAILLEDRRNDAFDEVIVLHGWW